MAPQRRHAIWFANGWYLPPAQPVHSTIDAGLNCPAAHPVHFVALVSLFVTEPRGQIAHATVAFGLNLPGGQGVHLVAPPAAVKFEAKLPVIEPGRHPMHDTAEGSGAYCPAAHAMHEVFLLSG